MAVNEHKTGGYRAYRQINGVVHQLYSQDKSEADARQADLDKKAIITKSLKAPNLFRKCGRLVYLSITKYKKTNRPVFQFQPLIDGKQKKTERFIKGKFESSWFEFYKLWKENFGLTTRDALDYKLEIKAAKNLYISDLHKIKSTIN